MPGALHSAAAAGGRSTVQGRRQRLRKQARAPDHTAGTCGRGLGSDSATGTAWARHSCVFSPAQWPGRKGPA